MIKKISFITLCFFLTFNLYTIHTHAITSFNYKEKWILHLFNSPNSYSLFDSQNNDITLLFYNENITYYNNKNYQQIFKNFDSHVYKAIKSTLIPIEKTTFRTCIGDCGTDSGTYAYNHEIFDKAYVEVKGSYVEFLYNTSGTYRIEKGKCTYISPPSFSLNPYTHAAIGNLYTVNLYYPRANVYPTTESITYVVQYHVKYKYGGSSTTTEIISKGSIRDTYIN